MIENSSSFKPDLTPEGGGGEKSTSSPAFFKYRLKDLTFCTGDTLNLSFFFNSTQFLKFWEDRITGSDVISLFLGGTFVFSAIFGTC